MHDFVYVPKSEYLPVKKELMELINEVQDAVREHFTFNFYFIGSSSRNMITMDTKSNIGFDFDVNIEVNDDDENYEPKEIRNILRNAFDQIVPNYGYDYCEDSTRVLTIKFKDYENSKILHSCDFAVVYYCEDGRQQYIRYNKARQDYTWEYQPKGYEDLEEKAEWLKENDLWNDLKEYYLEKKNNNTNPDKHSRALYAESINEMCAKNYYPRKDE
jgi:hypothetical protein